LKFSNSMEKEALEGNIEKALLAMSLPLTISDLSEVLYNLTDTLWLSWLGAAQVAAPTVSWPPIYVLLSFGNGLISVGYANISKAWGKRDLDEAKRNAGSLFLFSLLFSFIVSIVSLLFSGEILKLMGVPQDVYPFALIYFRLILVATPLAYITIAFSVISSSIGDAYVTMRVNLFSALINAILDPVLIFGLAGSPRLGVAGAAIATLVARGIVAIYCIVLLFFKYDKIRLNVSHLALSKQWTKSAFVIGSPLGIHRASNSLGQTVLVSVVSAFGSKALAAYGIGMRIIDLIQTFTSGLGRATAVVVGLNLGKGEKSRVIKASISSLKLMFLTLSALGAILIAFRTNLMEFFSNDTEVIALGSSLLLYSAISLPFFGLFFTTYGISNGSGKTYFFGILSVIRTWVLRVGVIILAFAFFKIQANDIWEILAISNILSGAVGALWVMKKRWLV